MSLKISSEARKLYVHTGNILNLNEVKKKVGQNLADEVLESLRITLAEWQSANTEPVTPDIVQIRSFKEGAALLLDAKEERKDLKVGLKLFLPISPPTNNIVNDSVSCLLTELGTGHAESLVLAQAGRQAEGVTPEEQLQKLKKLWTLLETEVQDGRVLSAGVSDLDTEQFVNLHTEAKVKPGIVQINLATCCVVPPALQAFAKEHEVQLLTHSDPLDLLPSSQIEEMFGAGWCLSWVLRFQVHVKCRGVLASKGYILCIEKDC